MMRYYGHGKLLLSGEYAVLDGALALAIPTRAGQSLEVELKEEAGLTWRSLNPDGAVWFEGTFLKDDVAEVTYEGKSTIGRQLEAILRAALGMRTYAPQFPFHHTITTRLEFERDWGLGSSSTLIHNISQWLDVDPYRLLLDTIGGSGYDVACAGAIGPILYQLKDSKPIVTPVDFNPAFKDDLCFVYLGQKQKSSEAIAHYRKVVNRKPDFLDSISTLTKDILACTELDAFEYLLDSHEALLSEALRLPRVQEQFSDYPGKLKSLGAWGGDFILATRAQAAELYFKKKGLTPVIPLSEMIL